MVLELKWNLDAVVKKCSLTKRKQLETTQQVRQSIAWYTRKTMKSST